MSNIMPVKSTHDCPLAYIQNAQLPEIQEDVNKSYELTRRWNMHR